MYHLLLLALMQTDDRNVPDSARQEIDRRGTMTEHVDGRAAIATDRLGPPADDSHKPFLSLLLDRTAASDQLRADWRRSPALLAWAQPDDPPRSYTHYHEYYVDDPAQRWRIKHYRYSRLPAVVLQAPLSGTMGTPGRVMAQIEGYDGQPDRLAAKLRYAVLQDGHRQPADAQDSRYTPPFSVAPPPQPPQQTWPPAPPPQAEPQPTVSSTLASPTLQTLLLAALIAVQLWREYRRRNGLPLILDDASYQRLADLLRRMTGPPPAQS